MTLPPRFVGPSPVFPAWMSEPPWHTGSPRCASLFRRRTASCRWLQALSRELSALSPSSPAAALVAEDGSGFEALAGIVEQVEGVRFRELFARLPATRAATGPEALRQVLAALAAAAAAGEDIEPLLAEVRNQLRQSAPNIDESQLDALLSALRSAASDRAAGAEHGAAVPEP
jgi:hypothetical protein